MPSTPPVEPKLAEILRDNSAAIVDKLAELEWLADPSAPTRLVHDPAAVRPRVELFLNSLISGLADGDWASYTENIAEPTAALLRAGIVTAQQINDRVQTMVGAILPHIEAVPDCSGLVLSLFAMMQHFSSGLVADHHAHLLGESSRLNEIKSLFMRLTSHELRSPLTITRGYASLLLDTPGATPEFVADAATRIMTASDTALSLINGLAEVASLEQEAGVLQVRAVHLAELIDRAVRSVQAEASAGGVSIEPEVSDAVLDVDPDRFVIAVRNMVSNAVKYGATRTGATAAVVRVTAAVDDNNAEVAVEDDGPGIPDEERERIFERYYRTDSSRRSQIPGSGLGLYIVKRIAELHGGDVVVASAPGRGTRFVLSIPLAPPGSVA